MKLHILDGYIQKIYLVEYPHGLLLLDGCSRPDVSLLRDFIQQTLARPFSDLKLVVVTHMHPDHAGAAHTLRDLTGCQIVSGVVDRPWYRGMSGWLMFATDLILTQWVAGRIGKRRQNVWYSPVLRPDRQLADGQSLPGFEDWQVVTTPGHTDRDISLWHMPSNKMYVADLMVQVKGRFCPPFPVFHPNQYRASLHKVRAMQPAALWLAHVGEVTLTDAQFEHVLTLAPNKPKTHWRATKLKVRQLILRTSKN